MGNKKPSVRTLPTGEKVTHHPDGTQVMLYRNSLGGQLAAVESLQTAESAALTEQRLAAVEEKRAAQQAGTPVPRDKSVL